MVQDAVVFEAATSLSFDIHKALDLTAIRFLSIYPGLSHHLLFLSLLHHYQVDWPLGLDECRFPHPRTAMPEICGAKFATSSATSCRSPRHLESARARQSRRTTGVDGSWEREVIWGWGDFGA